MRETHSSSDKQKEGITWKRVIDIWGVCLLASVTWCQFLLCDGMTIGLGTKKAIEEQQMSDKTIYSLQISGEQWSMVDNSWTYSN